jgi:hypothetical protein
VTTALHVLSGPDFFRCEKGAGDGPPCTMSKVACVRFQGAKRRLPGKGHKRRAIHPYCASGDCEQGQGIAVELAARGVEVHVPLLHRNVFGKQQVHRPVTPAKEETMPRGMRATPCPKCGSKGTRHRAGCGGPAAVATSAARAGAQPFDPALLSDQDLAACVRELVHRRATIEREAAERVRALEEALRGVGPAHAAQPTGTGG